MAWTGVLDTRDDGAKGERVFLESEETGMGKEVLEKTRELSQLRGEDLHGLSLEELQRLESTLEGGLHCVLRTKDERIAKEIESLQQK
nr:MADS-box protein SVP-like [Tanacetum cinerariifolium]